MVMICPKCQYERGAADTAPDWQCPSCGVAYNKAALAAEAAAEARERAEAAPTQGRKTTFWPLFQALGQFLIVVSIAAQWLLVPVVNSGGGEGALGVVAIFAVLVAVAAPGATIAVGFLIHALLRPPLRTNKDLLMMAVYALAAISPLIAYSYSKFVVEPRVEAERMTPHPYQPPPVMGEYKDTGGEVLDKRSELTWAMCAVGQSHTIVQRCTGSPSTLKWTDAQRQAGGIWRVPTMNCA
jgi:hypothetical protein